MADAGAALLGARAILTERFAEDADLIGELRERMWTKGRLVARVRDGEVLRAGDTVVVADTEQSVVESSSKIRSEAEMNTVRYQVLCRRHFRLGDLGPAMAQHGQLRLT